MRAQPQESTYPHDRVRHRPVGRDADVRDGPDVVAGQVEHVLPEDLLLRTSAGRDLAQLRNRDRLRGGSCNLGHCLASAREDGGGDEHYESRRSHADLPSRVRLGGLNYE